MTSPTNSGKLVKIQLYVNTEPMLLLLLRTVILSQRSKRQCVETIQEEPKLKLYLKVSRLVRKLSQEIDEIRCI